MTPQTSTVDIPCPRRIGGSLVGLRSWSAQGIVPAAALLAAGGSTADGADPLGVGVLFTAIGVGVAGLAVIVLVVVAVDRAVSLVRRRRDRRREVEAVSLPQMIDLRPAPSAASAAPPSASGLTSGTAPALRGHLAHRATTGGRHASGALAQPTAVAAGPPRQRRAQPRLPHLALPHLALPTLHRTTPPGRLAVPTGARPAAVWARCAAAAALPLVVLLRTAAQPRWLSEGVDGTAEAGLLLAAAVLGAAGLRWLWTATAPPYALRRRRALREADGRRAQEQAYVGAATRLLLSLAAGQAGAQVWRRFEDETRLTVSVAARAAVDPDMEPAALVRQLTARQRRRRARGHDLRNAVAVPALTLLLPAAVLLLVV